MQATTMIPLLRATALFEGFTESELTGLLQGLPYITREFPPNATLLMAGDETGEIGVVLSGKIEARKESRAGAAFTVSQMGPGGVFGDVLSGAASKSPVTVYTPGGCEVLLIPYAALLQGTGSDALQRRLLQNLVRLVAAKYFALDKRIDLLLTKKLRCRIAAYLLDEAERQGSNTFTIPFKRAALADYLGCERSALSRELSRMQADGLIETFRQSFRLQDPAALSALL